MAVNPGEVMKTGNAEGRNKTEQDRGHYQRNEREKFGMAVGFIPYLYMIQITTHIKMRIFVLILKRYYNKYKNRTTDNQ